MRHAFLLLADIDECQDGSHMCRYSQICQNTVGGYGCVCPRGYRSQGLGRPCLGEVHKHNQGMTHICSTLTVQCDITKVVEVSELVDTDS